MLAKYPFEIKIFSKALYWSCSIFFFVFILTLTMKLCLSEDQVTISFQHREVLKVCPHTECHLDPAWLANACLVNTDFSSDSASRAPERGLKLQSWTWCFLWDGQKEPFEKDQKRWTHYRRLFWGWEMNNKEDVFHGASKRELSFPSIYTGALLL